MGDQGLSDYDIFLLRKFCADGLERYIEPMKDFWEHAASYSERGPGEHPLADGRFADSTGYRVEKRKISKGPLRGVAAYPFVRVRSLKVLPSDGGARFALRKALDEPLSVGGFHCVLDGDKRIAFLDDRTYMSTITGSSVEACVVLGREEAYAVLAGKPLERTRKKLMRVFGIEEGEWLGE